MKQSKLELKGPLPVDLRGSSLVASVVQLLEQPIRDGLLSEGDRLPTERQIASVLRVSRVTVREALLELEFKGLIERRQGRGTTVTDTRRPALTQQLVRRLNSERRGFIEVMDLREATEMPVAERAAQYATPADLMRLEEVVERMEREVSAERYAELDVRFHYLVARATHNPLLVKIVEWSTEWTNAATRTPMLEGSQRRIASLAGHREILERIRSRDPEGAALAVRNHIRSILQEMEELFSERLPGAR